MDQDQSLQFEPHEKSVICVICCDEHDHRDPKLSQLFVRPCPRRECTMICCFSCMKDLFFGSLRDPLRFPPRCCQLLPLHAFSEVSATDEQSFKDRFDEWITPAKEKRYCPVPSCAAFIPPRLFNKVAQCPKCITPICPACKSVSHPEASCGPDEFSETRALIKKHGYKDCPGCGTGVRKEFGCSHVQCLQCGLHFCFACLQPLDRCISETECVDPQDDGCNCSDCMSSDEESSEDTAGESESEGESNGYDSQHDSTSDGSDATGAPETLPTAQDRSMALEDASEAEMQVTQPTLGTFEEEIPASEAAAQPASTASGSQVVDLEMQDAQQAAPDLGEEPIDDGSYVLWLCEHRDLADIEPIPANDEGLRPAQTKMKCHLCWESIECHDSSIPAVMVLKDKICRSCGLFMCHTCSLQF